MKILIETDPALSETEVVIRCASPDEDVSRLLAAIQATDRKLTGIRDDATFIIERRDVLYVESVDKKAFIYTKDGCYESPLRLFELEERLGSSGFVRTGKSSLVNLRHVRSIKPDMNGRLILTLSNAEKQIVSRQYAVNIKERLGVK
ncbi:MAG: LytTR family transcriptional regulator [Ruminococcaceae bacterium]|nr:LytTR family transcriptional regulator [Oscillospiraceae bacterium]